MILGKQAVRIILLAVRMARMSFAASRGWMSSALRSMRPSPFSSRHGFQQQPENAGITSVRSRSGFHFQVLVMVGEHALCRLDG
jgi:hypothetical protein